MNAHTPLYDNIEETFGDLLTLLDDREATATDRVMLGVTAAVTLGVAGILTGAALMAVLF